MTPNLSPDLDLYGERELLDMLAQNRADGLVPDPDQILASSHLGQVAAKISANTNVDPFTRVSPAFQETVQRSHFAMRELLTPLGVVLPELSDFAEAGIDFSELAEAHAAMEQLSLAPELVLAPTLSTDQWRQVYLNLQNNPRANSSGRIQNDGLYIDSAVENHWDELMQHVTSSNAHTLTASDGIIWQAMLLPGAGRPPLINLDHNGRGDNLPTPDLQQQIDQLKAKGVSIDEESIHPTIPAYLSLQATRLHTIAEPLDGGTYTWLDGEFKEGNSLRSPDGGWDPGGGRV